MFTSDLFSQTNLSESTRRHYEVDGWSYYTEAEREDDNIKLWHYAIGPTGEKINIDYNPYSYIPKSVFSIWLTVGKPEKKHDDSLGPMNDEYIKSLQLKDVQEGASIDPRILEIGKQMIELNQLYAQAQRLNDKSLLGKIKNKLSQLAQQRQSLMAAEGLTEDDIDYEAALRDYLAKGGTITKLPTKKPRKAERLGGSRHIGGAGDPMKSRFKGISSQPYGTKLVGIKETELTELYDQMQEYFKLSDGTLIQVDYTQQGMGADASPSSIKISTVNPKVKPPFEQKPWQNARPNIKKAIQKWVQTEYPTAVEENRFDEPLTGYHIVNRKSGDLVRATPSFETRDQAQKYLMTKMFANHQDFKVVHTAELTEDLRKWFKEKWVRFGPDGKIRGACARGDDSEGKPKCLPQSKAHALGKKGRASAAARKRKQDPNPERKGKAINVATKKKYKQGVAEGTLNEFDHARHVKLLNAYMKKLGYKNIGAGLDAQVFAKETGPVTKILMPKSGDISTAENPFLAFYNYCQANARNPHLPKFLDINKDIELDGEKFRQITMERLQEVDPDYDDMILDMIESIEEGQPLDPQYRQHAKFYQTLKSVMATGSRLGFENDIMDFNNSNVMQRGNTLVIADPWIEGGGLAEGKTLKKRVRVVQGPHSGKTGWIREIQHGLYQGAPKRYYVDLDDDTQVNNVPARALRLIKDEQGVAEGREEDFGNGITAEELHIGDDVIITGPVKYQGATGVIDSFGRNKSFVVVNLYNHGKHSFHSSDVEFNDYAGSEEEEAELNRRGERDFGLFGDDDRDDDDDLREHNKSVTQEEWSEKYKRSINCNNPKGFSQRAHCQGRKKNESQEINEITCPHCGGPMEDNRLLAEKKDACYRKVRSRYKVWPSAYASGALVQCRKKGAANWGSKKKNESAELTELSKETRADYIAKATKQIKDLKPHADKGEYTDLAKNLIAKRQRGSELAKNKSKTTVAESQDKLYYAVIGTSESSLRDVFGMSKDDEGWYLNESATPKQLLDAERAFGKPI